MAGSGADPQPDRWYLPVTPGISTGHGFLFGGCGLGRGHRRAGGHDRAARGVGHGPVPVLRPAAVGDGHRRHHRGRRPPHHPGPRGRPRRRHRDPDRQRRARAIETSDASGQWADACRRPAAGGLPAPRATAGTSTTRSCPGSTAARRRARHARPRRHARHGRSRCGPACPTCSRCRPPRSAILGDYVPFGIGQALGATAGGNSLDNTLRVGRPRADRVGAARHPRPRRSPRASATALVHLWAEDGTLSATASQSTIVRSGRTRRPLDRP